MAVTDEELCNRERQAIVTAKRESLSLYCGYLIHTLMSTISIIETPRATLIFHIFLIVRLVLPASILDIFDFSKPHLTANCN